jgi:hypothetical protein
MKSVFYIFTMLALLGCGEAPDARPAQPEYTGPCRDIWEPYNPEADTTLPICDEEDWQ